MLAVTAPAVAGAAIGMNIVMVKRRQQKGKGVWVLPRMAPDGGGEGTARGFRWLWLVE